MMLEDVALINLVAAAVWCWRWLMFVDSRKCKQK